jgi:thiol:disulfide interchange protein DsbC
MLIRAMHKLFYATFLLIFSLLPIGSAYGFEAKGQDCAKCHTLGNDEAKDLLKGIFPEIKIVDIRISPAKAFWEVLSESGGRKGLIYIDFSKKYLILGSMISIKERRNLTQERFAELNKIDVSQIPLDDALVMGDPKARIRIIAFDDPD